MTKMKIQILANIDRFMKFMQYARMALDETDINKNEIFNYLIKRNDFLIQLNNQIKSINGKYKINRNRT